MDPIEAASAIIPIASECARVLLWMAAPKLHPRLRTDLPAGTDAASLRALFDRFAQAARQFDDNAGLLEGSDRFVRAARTLQKMNAAMHGWQPMHQAPPENVVQIARTALRHLGTTEPDGGWDAFDDGAEPEASD
jgi:hypothetical protein